MCGIVGFLMRDPHATPPRERLERMTDCMRNRGPDERGTWIDGPIGFGHRRLSIIDLSTGQQPMHDPRRARVLTYNGEIYNFRALRDALPAQTRAQLRTTSDTEILLQLADFDSLDWLERLNGMFAFALWDPASRRLLLARDRLGVKPLYYVDTGEAFVFASEIKPLLMHPGVTRRVNESRLAEFLAFRSVAGDETLFAGIRQVAPGHAVLLEPDEYRPRFVRFWREGADTPESDYPAPGRDHTERFIEILKDAVRHRLVADVPVGTYNSGGLDSSLVTALARSLKPGELHTFSVGFDEASHDESHYADLVSKRFGTTHHTLRIDKRTYAKHLEETALHLEEPINHPHTVQLLLLSRLARQHVKVVLTGEGSDEVFGGYPRYNIVRLARMARLLPDGSARLLARAMSRTGSRRIVKLSESLGRDETALAIDNARFVPRADLARLSVPAKHPAAREAIYRDQSMRAPGDAVDRLLHYEQRTYLSSLLTRLDKTSMAASIEARVPFLDYRLVEWSYRLGSQLKIRAFANKWLVKSGARAWLPKEIVQRRKVGFDVPIGAWMRDADALAPRLELLRDATFRQRGRFDARAVALLLDEHESRRADHSEVLWGLLGVELWERLFIDAATCRT